MDIKQLNKNVSESGEPMAYNNGNSEQNSTLLLHGVAIKLQ